MPASIVDAPAASTASNRIRIAWPAHGSSDTDADAQVPATAVADPVRSQTTVCPPSCPSTIARRWSAEDALAACPSSQRKNRRCPAVPGSWTCGERIVVSPSRSYADGASRRPAAR